MFKLPPSYLSLVDSNVDDVDGQILTPRYLSLVDSNVDDVNGQILTKHDRGLYPRPRHLSLVDSNVDDVNGETLTKHDRGPYPLPCNHIWRCSYFETKSLVKVSCSNESNGSCHSVP
jgi:hypothetical protein